MINEHYTKQHDQRKGQWLYNALRSQYEGIDFEKQEVFVCSKLFNMSNEEFDKIMERYFA